MTLNWKPKLKGEDQPLYQSIVESLSEDISSGLLPSGTRLPTHRELADSLGVAIGTVTHAYAEAEQRGLVHGEGRRGTFVGESRQQLARGTGPFEQDSSIIDLERYFPATSDDPDLPAVLRKLARGSLAQWLIHYTRCGGLRRHREAGSVWIERLGLQIGPESVVMTAGAQHALHTILSLILKDGDAILADSHTYPGLKSIAKVLGAKLIGLPTDNEGILPHLLETTCQENQVGALYCIPSMHNPTCVTMSESRKIAIADLAEKYGFMILEDEINRALIPDPTPLISSFAPDRTFLIASVSKVIAAGLRACFVTGPNELLGHLERRIQASIQMVPPLLQEIFLLWLKDGTVDRTIIQRRRESIHRQGILCDILGSHCKITTNPYSYFAWLQLPEDRSALNLVKEARAEGILVSPSEIFACEGYKPANAVRICLEADTTRNSLRKALVTLAEILANPRRTNAPTM
jgi:DNA-binding transcriptional MocR family regulator